MSSPRAFRPRRRDRRRIQRSPSRRRIATPRPRAPASMSRRSTRWAPSDWPTVAPNWVNTIERRRTSVAPRSCRTPAAPAVEVGGCISTDTQAVIAQAERRKGDGETARIGALTAAVAGRGRSVGLAVVAVLDERVEIGAAGQARRVPPRAVASSATAMKAPPMPCARMPIASVVCAPARETTDTEETTDRRRRDTPGPERRCACLLPYPVCPVCCLGVLDGGASER